MEEQKTTSTKDIDEATLSLAKSRDKKGAKFISHEEAWDSNLSKEKPI